MPLYRLSIAQGHVFGLISSWKDPINMCQKVIRYEDTEILRIKVADIIMV